MKQKPLRVLCSFGSLRPAATSPDSMTPVKVTDGVYMFSAFQGLWQLHRGFHR